MDDSTQPEIDSSKLNGLIQIRWYKRSSDSSVLGTLKAYCLASVLSIDEYVIDRIAIIKLLLPLSTGTWIVLSYCN